MAGDCCGCEETCGAPSYLCTLRKEPVRKPQKKDYGKSKGYSNEEIKKLEKIVKALKIRVDGMTATTVDSTLGARIDLVEHRLQSFQ